MRKAERKALAEIQKLVGENSVEFTEHALEEMIDEMTTVEEVRGAIEFADDCEIQPNGRWKICCNASDLVVIVEIQDNAVIVTVFGRA